MAFTIPNYTGSIEDPTGIYPQSQWDKVDIDIFVQGINGEGVSSGCAVTQRGAGANNSVDVAAGAVVIAGVQATVTGGNVTMTAAHATLRRKDLITVNASGTKAYTAGTAASSPVFPAVPANSVALAMIYVPANDNIINSNQIIDKRAPVSTPAATSGWTTLSTPADVTRNSTTTFADDATMKWTTAINTKYRIQGNLWYNAAATPDMKWQFAFPGTVTLFNMHWQMYATTALVSAAGFDAAVNTSHSLVLSAGADLRVEFEGILQVSGTGGIASIQWAQNTSDVGNTIMRAGSTLEYSVA